MMPAQEQGPGKEPQERVAVGQTVEVVSRHIPQHLGLHKYDGSTGKILSINQRQIAQVEITAEREDSPCGNIDVPKVALKRIGT